MLGTKAIEALNQHIADLLNRGLPPRPPAPPRISRDALRYLAGEACRHETKMSLVMLLRGVVAYLADEP